MQEAQSGHAAVPSAPGPSTLLIALDGAMVNTQRTRDGHRGWHEGKVGVCARFEPTPIPISTEETDDANPNVVRLRIRRTFVPDGILFF